MMADPGNNIRATDSPSHLFELLIGYVTDVVNDVQNFKVRKMDNMGDFIWADSLSTKLGRIKQLAADLKGGYDDSVLLNEQRQGAEDANALPAAVSPPPQQQQQHSRASKTGAGAKGGAKAAGVAALNKSHAGRKSTSTAATHDAESVMSKEEEIEYTLKAKNKEMQERRKIGASTGVNAGASTSTGSSGSAAPGRKNPVTTPTKDEDGRKAPIAAPSTPGGRPRLSRPGPTSSTPAGNGRHGKMPPEKAPPPPASSHAIARRPESPDRRKRRPSDSSHSSTSSR